MKVDPYKHKERYLSWKTSINGKIPGLSEKNSKIVFEYILDMENGLNVASVSKKGARSYTRLNNLKQRMIFLIKQFEERYNLNDITQISERILHDFFTGIKNGAITRLDGKTYQSPTDYVKIFKAFWHWYQKVNRKQGKEVQDLTIDLDTSKEKPKWVYLDEGQIKKLCDNALYDYRVLMMFLFDTGIRAPTELMNIKVSDFHNDFKELNIRDEISKTFGRKIKVILGHEQIKGYVEKFNLGRDSFIAKLSLSAINKELRTLGKKILPKDRIQFKNLSLLDFRHASCCFWLSIYKSENALKYKFGWKKSDKIHYYSEFLGMKDTINEDDLYIDVTKTELEKEIADLKEKSVSKEDVLKLVKELLNSYNINSRPTKSNDALEVFEN